MSDLISRSKLIENFRKCYSGHLGMENSDACMTFHGICNVINNTNTAYDIAKVFEELKEVHEKFCKNVVCDELCEHCEEYIMFNKNIKIVKQGYVSDDVCEWKYINDFELTSDNHESKCIERCNYIYCPYCGKKIKIVGD